MDPVLSTEQIEEFIAHGYVCINHAFEQSVAESARKILWSDMDCNPADPSTWTRPVVRLGMYSDEPFIQAANTPVLKAAFDQLVGKDRWLPCMSMGSFPVRFPSTQDAGDTGWHVDAGFPGTDPGDYISWRINYKSRGRALLMLFLFSDIGPDDAPTRIRCGSHKDVARLLQQHGEEGLSFMELADKLGQLPHRNEVAATGEAGTVYLCHPFIAHAAQPHRGTQPRFMAQPPLLLRNELTIEGNPNQQTPLEQSIRLALL